MKIIKSTPTNPEILNTYGGLLKVATLLIMFSMFISSLTEMGVSYSFFDSKFSFMGNFGLLLTILLTFAFVLLLEGGGKLSLSYSIDFFLYQRWKDKGLELILGIIVILTTLVLYFTSINISLEGSPKVVKSFEEKPTMLSTQKIDSLLNIEKSKIQSTFSEDSTLVTQGYNNVITSFKNEYKGKIEKVETRIENYKRKQQRTGKSYTTTINNLKGEIADLESKKSQKIGQEESNKIKEMRGLITDRKKSLKNIKLEYKNEKGEIEKVNNSSKQDHENEIKSSSDGLGNLILICVPILFLSVLVQRIIYKKAGIKVSYNFTDYYFRDSILNTWLNYVQEWMNEKAHSKIHKWHSNVKAVELVDRPTIIFNREGNTQYVMTKKEEVEDVELIALNSNVNYDRDKYKLLSEYVATTNAKDEKLSSVSSLEKKALELMEQARAERAAGNEDAAKKIEMKAKHVIKAFFETDFTPKYSKKMGRKFRANLEGYLEGLNSNPFDDFLPQQRRKIGFKMEGGQNAKNHGRTEPTPNSHYHFHGDKHTVPHQQDNGKIKQVGMNEILSKINLYSGRVSESFNKLEKSQKSKNVKGIKTHSDALKNREERLNYWNNKKGDLLNQGTK